MPAVSFSFTAANCPPVPPLPTMQDLTNDAVAPTTADAITDGMHALDMAPFFNKNAKREDNVGRYGGGGPAINEGMALSDSGTALTVRTSAGVVGIEAGVQFAQTDTALPDNATTHLWGTSGGVITLKSDLTIPTGIVAYLGRATLATGAFTVFDASGVLYRRGGYLWRKTADAGAPTDTPPSTISFIAETAGGLYLWTGSAYRAIYNIADKAALDASPRWVKATKLYSDLSAAATTNNIEVYSLPAGSVIHAVKLKHSAAFTGGSLSAYTLSVGIAGTLAKYSAAFDVWQAPGNTVFQVTGTIGSENHGAATSIKLAAVSTGANLSAATAGSVDAWILVSSAV